MEAKHTPGTWAAEYGTDGYYFLTYNDGLELRETKGGDNARLIAAAPELLAACLAIDEQSPIDSEWGYCGCCNSRNSHDLDCAVHLARAAIAKAMGGKE